MSRIMLMLVTNVPIFLARFFSIIVICSASFFRARDDMNKMYLQLSFTWGLTDLYRTHVKKDFQTSRRQWSIPITGTDG